MKPNTNIQRKTPCNRPPGGRPAKRAPNPRTPVRQRRTLRGTLIVVLCALLVGGATWALFEFVIWNTTPTELVGKWVVTEGPQEGATFDFYRGGRMVGVVNVGGKEGIVEARIRVEDNKIFSTTRNPNTGRDDTRVLVIRRLSATDLVLEDEQSGLLKMERAN
jgi:hypothetical protein